MLFPCVACKVVQVHALPLRSRRAGTRLAARRIIAGLDKCRTATRLSLLEDVQHNRALDSTEVRERVGCVLH